MRDFSHFDGYNHQEVKKSKLYQHVYNLSKLVKNNANKVILSWFLKCFSPIKHGKVSLSYGWPQILFRDFLKNWS